MRMSRLYLVLSIVSLGVAAAIGAAQHGHHRYECHAEKPHPITSEEAIPARIYEFALQRHDFAAMEAQGKRMLRLAQDDDLDVSRAEYLCARGHCMRAYALRGTKQYRQAVDEYNSALLVGENDAPAWLVIDCYTGRAACHHALGEAELARRDATLARLRAQDRVTQSGQPENRYQLACAYAVESLTQQGMKAAETRGRALTQLKLALAKDYAVDGHAAADIDLDALRNEPDFQALLPNN